MVAMAFNPFAKYLPVTANLPHEGSVQVDSKGHYIIYGFPKGSTITIQPPSYIEDLTGDDEPIIGSNYYLIKGISSDMYQVDFYYDDSTTKTATIFGNMTCTGDDIDSFHSVFLRHIYM